MRKSKSTFSQFLPGFKTASILMGCFFSCSMEPKDMFKEDVFKFTNKSTEDIYCYVSEKGNILELDTIIRKLETNNYFYPIQEIPRDSSVILIDSGIWSDTSRYVSPGRNSVTLFVISRPGVEKEGWSSVTRQKRWLGTYQLDNNDFKRLNGGFVYNGLK